MIFDHIEFFMSCASCLNFSLAAKYHFVSVSTLSRSVSSLEDELGVKLFERGYHGHRLTEAGKAFFELSMHSTLGYNDFILKHSRRHDDSLIIGCYPFNGNFARLINCLSNAPSDFLGKKFRVYFIPEGAMLQAVKSGTIHAGIEADTRLTDAGEMKTGSFYCDDNGSFSFIAEKGYSDFVFGKLCSMGVYHK